MKLIILGIALLSSSFTSCDSNNSNKSDNITAADTVNETINQTEQSVLKDSATLQDVLKEYLRLKNALVAGKSKEAAEAGKSLKNAIDSMGLNLMNEAQQEVFSESGAESKKYAEQIGAGTGGIRQQREHFQVLSNNIYDLVKVFGTSQTLYKDYCPMVKAIWLSETRPIKNPYYGSNMLTCGELQETIQN